ncbi:TMV resistance protein N-like [Gastrolobium bilobum]|uniref:TMV resistance protein N-like n=1 Tax=Gastrolobium bilobum TaxID=150636 RepID=UPI002AB15498|nr:TMV resistance protein N-like [Gastrolobium bilobum]
MANHDATSSDFSYDVFLSFRCGSSNALVDRLVRALLDKGINTFRDQGKLRIGDDEIEKSRMSMVVLCENYASSIRCLDELAKITEYIDNKRKHVTAIFYKVEPSDIRKQRNSYEAAMTEHEKTYGKDSEKVKAWRSALTRVCDISGKHCKDDSFESELIEKIVKDTLTKVAPAPLQINHGVGLDSHFEQVKSLIDIGSNDTVRMLGIYGAGGIGKTAFAVCIYNKIRHEFGAASFLVNVREKSEKSIKGLEDLQKELLSQMGEETETMVGSAFKGGIELKRRLGHRRVLLVLDDVNAMKQLESLAGGCDWFGSGSRIIITTRDEAVLDNHDVGIKKYKMEELNDRDSLELFCWYAFNMRRPAENFVDISTRAVSYAKGIPLALRVIGSNLKDGSVEEWEIELGKYRKVPDAEIQGILEISYYGLSELEKKIFLDIACFFKGERWEYVKRILEACDFFPTIRVFVSKCLITIDENGCLDMHDLIQDMGREIVRKESPSSPGNRSRLWSYKDVLQVLEGNSGSSTIEGIMLHPPRHEEVDHWTNTSFENMRNLRILIVRNTTFSTGPSYLSNSLRLLDWMGFPSQSFPADFYPQRIVDFKLSHSPLILKKPLQIFEDLTFINLSQCQYITQIPDLSGAKNLRILTLDRCHKLDKFDKSIGFMPNLVYLSASECTMLKSFVPRMYLPSLEVLSFNFCKRLEDFPEVMRKMDKPLKICMINTAIKEFPRSICYLTGLEYVDLSNCKALKDLSRGFLLLPKLVKLKMDGSSQLGESFKRFKESHLVANGCPKLMALYLSEVNLSCEDLCIILQIFPKLEYLDVSHNDFVFLPKCITQSLPLKSLDVSYCRNLMEIPELPLSIQKVDARYCRSLTSEASSMLWSKVCKEIQRIQVVMPKTEVPDWFDSVGNEDIPLFWARRKFPVVALAFVFEEVKENVKIEMNNSEFLPGVVSADQSHTVGLHLFIDGQEICSRANHYFTVGENHVLLCDLRVLFSEEEWQGLDANLGYDWKAIQVQYESRLNLRRWGVHVYKQETITDDIRFDPPNSTENMPPSHLVPKTNSQQRIRHVQSLDLLEIFGQYLNFLKLDQIASVTNVILRSWRNAKADDVKEDASASAYGASLKQEQEEFVWDVAQVLDMLMENVQKQEIQNLGRLVVELLTARAQLMKTKGHEMLHININMPIILDECECHTSKNLAEAPSRRYWGSFELEEGDPLVWRFWKSNEAFGERVNTVLLKCQRSYGESLEEEYNDPALQALMRKIEQDAMRLNKSWGKMKASIVSKNVPVSDKYMMETAIIIGQERLGRLGSNFNKAPYGKLRVEHDAQSTNQNQKPHELRVEHNAESNTGNQNQNQKQTRFGWTKIFNRRAEKNGKSGDKA